MQNTFLFPLIIVFLNNENFSAMPIKGSEHAALFEKTQMTNRKQNVKVKQCPRN